MQSFQYVHHNKWIFKFALKTSNFEMQNEMEEKQATKEETSQSYK